MREANAIDFWRGFALVTIFINHIPGNYYSRFTHGNISDSDSADLFVFLAGWSMRYATGADTTGMDEVATPIDADQKRTQVARATAPAANHHLLAAAAFRLQPGVGTRDHNDE